MDGITDISDDLYRYTVSGFGHQLPATKETTQRENGNLHRIILSTYSMNSTRRLVNIKQMSGSASVSVERNDDGNTTATAEISVTSDDGAFEVSGSGSVDQDGNTSGKIEATYNWKE